MENKVVPEKEIEVNRLLKICGKDLRRVKTTKRQLVKGLSDWRRKRKMRKCVKEEVWETETEEEKGDQWRWEEILKEKEKQSVINREGGERRKRCLLKERNNRERKMGT